MFERIHQEDTTIFDMSSDSQTREELHKYTGTLDETIESTLVLLEQVLQQEGKRISGRTLLELILMNARIIRGILDAKCFPNPELYVESIAPVHAWMESSTSIYTLSQDAGEKVKELKKMLRQIGGMDILQRYDSETWKSMHPHFSRLTREKISKEVGRDDYVFIALGHGGIALGFDIFLQLKDTLDGAGSFYPLRFSRAKRKDKVPRIQDDIEKQYIRDMIHSKTLILFDEDASSGNTLRYAKTYFEDHIGGSARILLYSNIGVFGIQR